MHKYKLLNIKNKGFGLVDAILSITLLSGIITYGVYFSSLRLNTVFSSNLIRSVNKEIERDIERLKLDLWGLFYDKDETKYKIEEDDCEDFTQSIVNLPSWKLNSSSANNMIQTWAPGPERSKVFSGEKVLITRELIMLTPANDQTLNNSIGRINYFVNWGNRDQKWLGIDLAAESHSWCDHKF